MKIDEEIFRYWGLFGFKLSRMEFIWDRSFPETEREFDSALDELLFMIGDSFIPSQKSYKDFSSQILLYYQKENIHIYSSILIGICLQRYQLSSSVSEKYRKGLRELARSALLSIPKTVVPDKDFLFSTIAKCNNMSFLDACSMIVESFNIMFDSETITNSSHQKPYDANGYAFISYSTKDMKYISAIKKTLEDNGIRFWVAPDSIPAGSEYAETIVDAIENSSFVLLVLSENSQNSVWVPKELDIALSSEKLIMPIHIDTSVLNKKMRFRLSNSQIEEASEDFEHKLANIVSVINRIIKR